MKKSREEEYIMANTLKQIIGCFLILYISFISINFDALDVSTAEYDGKYVKNVVSQRKKTEDSTDKFEVNELEKRAIETYNAVHKAIDYNEDFDSVYSGAYINEDSKLVVLIVDKSDSEKVNELFDIVSDDTIIVKYVTNSYHEMETIKNTITEYMGDNPDSDVARFVCSAAVDEVNNGVVVGIQDMTDEKIALFKTKVLDSDMLRFIDGEKMDKSDEEATSLKLPLYGGMAIYTTKDGDIYQGSIGYRVKRTSGLSTTYGFVTAGHLGTTIGMAVYAGPSCTSKIGIVSATAQSGSVDAAYVAITSSVYEMENKVFYSNNSGGTVGESLNTTIGEPVVGSTVYKSGSKTYLTSGKVQYTSFDLYFNGHTITDLAQASYSSVNGDSGGTVYEPFYTMTLPNTTVGIHMASRGFFVKASNIKSRLGVVRY